MFSLGSKVQDSEFDTHTLIASSITFPVLAVLDRDSKMLACLSCLCPAPIFYIRLL